MDTTNHTDIEHTDPTIADTCEGLPERPPIVPLEDLGHEPTDDELMELFGRMRRSRMRCGHGGRGKGRRSAVDDPRSGQGRVLLLLKNAGTISQRDLARVMGVRPQSLGELLGKLEAAGYVERTPNKDDRRVMDVCITEAGRAVEQRPARTVLLADLDEQDRRDLYRVLAKMAASAEAQLEALRLEGADRPDEDAPRHEGRCCHHGHGHGPGRPPFGHHGHGCHGYRHEEPWGFGPFEGPRPHRHGRGGCCRR